MRISGPGTLQVDALAEIRYVAYGEGSDSETWDNHFEVDEWNDWEFLKLKVWLDLDGNMVSVDVVPYGEVVRKIHEHLKKNQPRPEQVQPGP
jgi:hypothetical protein